MQLSTILATTVLLFSSAAMAQSWGNNCLPECYVYSRDAEAACPKDHAAIGRQGPGCFQCCESV
ncbi:uncharacterized protein ACLA_048840 [Aspergillus clavatus NRRL 1]|uniref:Uncharacterized protein n=1 Tax=Aspergillus clavatus (strain ATCC 1007 / CBS 513.65 / DSM 816 / NCTC 3887 / NRRL 1 / QM 1276 / 107) TaxID=344612 RepID=A1CHQ7_ASPCL|nr:uncharacterized protein ACLA_048840 [Aspergillus clavatus NRRL 1]EAW10412.1 hypothetical protein ACLA_048840 [Aspergillus clavatus NRRL 1]